MIHGNAESCSAQNEPISSADEREYVYRINTIYRILFIDHFASWSDVTPLTGTSWKFSGDGKIFYEVSKQ